MRIEEVEKLEEKAVLHKEINFLKWFKRATLTTAVIEVICTTICIAASRSFDIEKLTLVIASILVYKLAAETKELLEWKVVNYR